MFMRLLTRAVALACLLFLTLPLAVLIGASLTSTSYLRFPPEGVTLRWYTTVLTDQTYVHSFALSTILAASATAVALALAIPAALALARYDFPGKAAIASLLSAPMVLPYLVLGSALLQFTGYLGFAQTFAALLVGHVLIVTPFILKSLSGVLTRAHMELERASADLGATPWETFRLVTLPMMKPGLVSGTIFGFITSWINVELSMFNTTAVLNTIPVQLFNYVQYSVDPSIAAVSAITIFISILVIIVLDLVVGLDVFSDKQRSH
ncbi:ABC transporter permease [Allopusillimonas soli]|uniref:ABC transporter permease n=1 Tax=Allopusillimonas soli TaxID=659016 RepID=A0A853FFE7_9BURK|nr:ABC transporter permease [Allopusillimonas soli]NYT37231.1 ABC transporter permease [Allopusillimonas soli]TEA74766.1 ABC transporter permease [Allopusillimonas soli]